MRKNKSSLQPEIHKADAWRASRADRIGEKTIVIVLTDNDNENTIYSMTPGAALDLRNSLSKALKC